MSLEFSHGEILPTSDQFQGLVWGKLQEMYGSELAQIAKVLDPHGRNHPAFHFNVCTNLESHMDADDTMSRYADSEEDPYDRKIASYLLGKMEKSEEELKRLTDEYSINFSAGVCDISALVIMSRKVLLQLSSYSEGVEVVSSEGNEDEMGVIAMLEKERKIQESGEKIVEAISMELKEMLREILISMGFEDGSSAYQKIEDEEGAKGMGPGTNFAERVKGRVFRELGIQLG